MTTRAAAPTPKGLSRRSGAFWRRIVADYVLEPHHLELLRSICHVMDRLDAVGEAIADGGVTVAGSKGQPRANPLLIEERGLHVTLARLLRELDLDAEPVPDVRPPRR